MEGTEKWARSANRCAAKVWSLNQTDWRSIQNRLNPGKEDRTYESYYAIQTYESKQMKAGAQG